MELFANMDGKEGKESMKMIMRYFKVNILPVQNGSGGHIWHGLLSIWKGNYFYLIKSGKCAK